MRSCTMLCHSLAGNLLNNFPLWKTFIICYRSWRIFLIQQLYLWPPITPTSSSISSCSTRLMRPYIFGTKVRTKNQTANISKGKILFFYIFSLLLPQNEGCYFHPLVQHCRPLKVLHAGWLGAFFSLCVPRLSVKNWSGVGR